jgi:hypothetical protein
MHMFSDALIKLQQCSFLLKTGEHPSPRSFPYVCSMPFAFYTTIATFKYLYHTKLKSYFGLMSNIFSRNGDFVRVTYLTGSGLDD